MKESLGQYRTRDGKSLFFRKWKGTGDVIIYIHGVESNSGWFSSFALGLNEKGFTLYGIDRRASGLNKETPRGDIRDYNTFFDDIEDAFYFVKEENIGRKIFLMGICWGALLLVNYTLKKKAMPDGLILLSPAIYRKVDLNIFVKAIAKICFLIYPKAHFKIPIKDNMFTRNKRFLDFIKQDKTRLRTLTCRFFNEIVKMERDLSGDNHKIHLPITVLLAGGDEIVNNKATKEWFKRLEAGDKTIKVFSEFSHVMPFEENVNPLLDFIASWTKEREMFFERKGIKN